jgi:hypothetical protein
VTLDTVAIEEQSLHGPLLLPKIHIYALQSIDIEELLVKSAGFIRFSKNCLNGAS